MPLFFRSLGKLLSLSCYGALAALNSSSVLGSFCVCVCENLFIDIFCTHSAFIFVSTPPKKEREKINLNFNVFVMFHACSPFWLTLLGVNVVSSFI